MLDGPTNDCNTSPATDPAPPPSQATDTATGTPTGEAATPAATAAANGTVAGPVTTTRNGTVPPAPADVVRFLAALFHKGDKFLLRPVETFTKDGKKDSRTAHSMTCHTRAASLTEPAEWNRLMRVWAEDRLNVFFGVCPRPAKNCDRAWHIRTVRTLWADLDHCTRDEAWERCSKAGLPPPSIIVNSGNGVHLYWLLDEPYQIDDAGKVRPVLEEWTDVMRDGAPVLKADGSPKRHPRAYVRGNVAEGEPEKVYEFLDDGKTKNPEFPHTLSPKAQHVQDVLDGIAARIGGDHTGDLSRLLRLPCTMNRKDERNGREPVPCVLLECDPECRYPFARFEQYAEASPDKMKRAKVAAIKLPAPVKLTKGHRAKLTDHVNRCTVADKGIRSHVDFALCCFAVREGLSAETVWAEVESVGKFAEGGRKYFERTWSRAEDAVRLETYEATSHAMHDTRKAASTTDKAGDSSAVPATDPPPGDGTAGPAPGEDRPNVTEKITDPHGIGRFWLGQHGHHGGQRTVAYYRQQFWVWDRKHWKTLPDDEVRADVTRWCKHHLDRETLESARSVAPGQPRPMVPPVTTSMVANVMQAAQGYCLVPGDVAMPSWRGENPGPRTWIAMDNGILDIDAVLAGKDEALRPHDPRWFSPTFLSYDYDPAASCPKWLACVERVLAGNHPKTELLQEWFGYLMVPDTTMQRFLALIGEGNNGKSTVLSVIRAMLGPDNYSTVAMELLGDKFRITETIGKLANIMTEVSEMDKLAEGQLKAFVAGEPMTVERKFKSPFQTRPTARIVAASNHPLRFADKSEGMWRRPSVLTFNVEIGPAERVHGMDLAEFWTEERSGILNWALAGLRRLRRNKAFTEPQESIDALNDARKDCNPALGYLLDLLEPGDAEEVINCAKLYEHYKCWCAIKSHRVLADNRFGTEVKRAFPKAIHKQKRDDQGKRPWYYFGLRPRKKEEPELQP
jgi:P4 family phage/plasmid primase-like protien